MVVNKTRIYSLELKCFRCLVDNYYITAFRSLTYHINFFKYDYVQFFKYDYVPCIILHVL